MAALLAGCTGGSSPPAGGAAAAATTLPASAPTVGRGDNHDGRLRVGALLPLAGPRAVTGVPMVTGGEMAVRDINAAGGVSREPVALARIDEGEGPDAAGVGLDQLLGADAVDAVVGPSTSRATLGLLDRMVGAELPSCSPAATAAALTDFDDHGLFVRTIGSDRLEGTAVGEAIAQTGRRRTAILAPDDDYGRGVADAIEAELDREGAGAYAVRYRPDDADLGAPVAEALGGAPEAVAVVGLPDAGGRLLAALATAGVRIGDGPDEVFVVVTDGLRVPDLYQRVAAGRPAATAGVSGVAPATVPPATATWFIDALASFAPSVAPDYAAYAYDCTVLLALAAEAAGVDDGPAIARQLVDVSGGGVRCESYARCASLLADGRNIDYSGAVGQIDLMPSGDADRGVYDVFEFNPDGSTTVRRRPIVTSA